MDVDMQTDAMKIAKNGVDPLGGGDSPDSRGRGSDARGLGPGGIPFVDVQSDEPNYKMNHPRRGHALILNHKEFSPKLNLRPRNGTDVDAANLRKRLQVLGFDVVLKRDLTAVEVQKEIDNLAFANHTDCDCVFIAVLSHGEMGTLYAKDAPYKPQMLWEPFTANNCPTLAGKPKMFFIQACQGDQLDPGAEIAMRRKTSTDNYDVYKIPVHADFLIAYSTIPGYFSWRNTTNGSWFIQALCHVLDTHGNSMDLLSMLTYVSRLVAFHFESNVPNDHIMHQKKQIPCVTTMLTRNIFFTPK